MADTRDKNKGVRGPRSTLHTYRAHSVFFDNYAVCPICATTDIRPCTERDDSVWYVDYTASYHCSEGHAFTSNNALWDNVLR